MQSRDAKSKESITQRSAGSSGAHPEIFKGGGVNFLKTNQYPIVINLFQPLMKMHAIILEQGFAVIAAFCYNICLLKNPVLTILIVKIVREGKRHHPGSEAPAAGQLQFFRKKIAILAPFCTSLEQLQKAKLRRFGGV